MSRLLDDWLDTYLEYASNSEPPYVYHLGCGLIALSSALQRKVWLPWGFTTIYPNLFIVLVGPSGKCRKGTSMDISADFMYELPIHIAPESTTREALIKKIDENRDSFLYPVNNETVFHCSMTVFSREFGVFIGKESQKLIEDLCDLYDSSARWSYETKTSGTNHLENVCLNLLGATTPSWLQTSLPQDAVGHGLTSRIIFAVADKKGKHLPYPFLTDRQKEMRPLLTQDLEQVQLLIGEMRFAKEVMPLYENWYAEAESNPRFKDERFEGYVARRPTHLRKLAMLSSVSRSDELVITEYDFHRAKVILNDLEKTMKGAFGGLGVSHLGPVQDKVRKYILEHKEVTRPELFEHFWRDADSYQMDVILRSLKEARFIRGKVDPKTNDMRYECIRRQV